MPKIRLRLRLRRWLIFLSVIVCHNIYAAPHNTDIQAPIFNNLGNFHYHIATTSPLAQQFFDQGLILYYGFEWGEAIRSFTEATRQDPQCSMCYWGLALALTAKINAPMTGDEAEQAKKSIDSAQSLAKQATAIEQKYIKALARRLSKAPAPTSPNNGFSCHLAPHHANAAIDKAYLHAMYQITQQYPHDNEAKALYAAALFWSLPPQPKDTNPRVIAGIKMVKQVLANNPLHVGANHYYIHFVEPYSHPQQATKSAARLATLVPGSEHLVHMPAHIYFLTGRYQEATDANLHAIAVFEQYNKTCRAQGFAPEINYLYLHNYDFLRTSATMQGQQQLALQAAQQLLAPPFASWLSTDPLLEWFMPIPYYVKARFGMWSAILHEPMPPTAYQYATGMLHYARGLALVHTNQRRSATIEAVKLKHIIATWQPKKNKVGKQGLQLLSLAREVLLAALADAARNEHATFLHLTTAMHLQDNMRYHEPPDWYFPVRQAIADAYLKWGHPTAAIFVYKQVLKQYPGNPWSLKGITASSMLLQKNKKK